MAELAQFLDQTQRMKARDGLWALWLVHTSMQTILDTIKVVCVTLRQWIKLFLPKNLFLSAVLPAHSSSTEMSLARIAAKSDRFSSPLPFLLLAEKGQVCLMQTSPEALLAPSW